MKQFFNLNLKKLKEHLTED